MIVDSSIWIEIIAQGPLQQACEKAIHRQIIRVPSLVLFEIYKRLKGKVSEDIALEAFASLSQHEILDMNREVALLAADLCLAHKIAMADGIVLAHAEILGDTLLTLDNDFADIACARVIRSQPRK